MNMTRRAVGLAAAAMLAAGGAVLAVPAAQAASSGGASAAPTPHISGTFTNYVTTNYVKIRSGPGTGYTAVGQAQTGQPLTDYCYTTGTSVNGNVYWDRVHDTVTGVTGYITEYYLSNKSQTLHC